MDYTKKSWVPV
jgi:hypothetical protein